MSAFPEEWIDQGDAIGGPSGEDRRLRLECLTEAREQLGRGASAADLLYFARLNARFVLTGETPRLRRRANDEEGVSRE